MCCISAKAPACQTQKAKKSGCSKGAKEGGGKEAKAAEKPPQDKADIKKSEPPSSDCCNMIKSLQSNFS